jgi:glycosyltransferase involved in cell wall biosynthesis
MTNLLFTIAIPAYNNEKTIQKTIDSCLNQKTDIAYEVLILDDASTDGTPEILARYDDPKVRVVTLKERIPLIANHNACFEKARGEYLIFCHADDTLEDHAIVTFADKLKKRNYPKKYIVWGHTMFRDYAFKAIHQAGFHYNEMAVGEFAPLMFLYGGLQPTGTCYSRESFIEAGGFFKVDMNPSPSDMTTMIYLAMNGFRFEMIDEMVLNREYATTSAPKSGENPYFDELDDAFKYFIEKVDRESIKKLVHMSMEQKVKPYFFYYAICQDDYHKKQVKSIVRREIMKKPWILRSPLIHKVLKRLYGQS